MAYNYKKTAAKGRSKRKKSTGKIAGWSLAFILALFCITAIAMWKKISDNKLPNFRHETVIYVHPETTADEVYSDLIKHAGVLRPRSLDRAFRDKKVPEYLKPGKYLIKPEYTSVYVARMLNNCWQTPAQLTLSGTMRLKSQIAGKISSQILIDSAEVMQALSSEKILSAYGYTPENVFSLFIPDTYEMYWTATMKDVLAKQKQANDNFWNEERLSKAKALGLSRDEVSVIASIVNSETNYVPEMPMVAGVYLNRMKKGMKLQADPTIAFCFDYEPRRILLRHLEVESPYNTYKYEGLPPGPICVPSKASLDAVLNPQGDYLYFCANSNMDGTHLFAKDFSTHAKNAKAFQDELSRRRNAPIDLLSAGPGVEESIVSEGIMESNEQSSSSN